MPSSPVTSRRSFLARSATIAAIPAVATLTGGALTEPASADTLPDYAPVPPSALGPAVNEQGYFVGRVKKNLYWVTDGTYQAAFLTTREGVVLFDAPPTIGHNLQRAIDQIAAANGVSNQVTHLVYSHHHADHIGASSLFGRDVVRVGSREQAAAGARQRPDPAGTRRDLRRALHASRRWGADRPGLAGHQPHPGQHLHPPAEPRHAHARRHHPARLGAVLQLQPERERPGIHRRRRQGPVLPVEALHRRPHGSARHPRRHRAHQQYVADIVDNVRNALATVDPTPYFTRYGNNAWAAVTTYLDAVADYAAAPVITKYTGVLAAADVLTASNAFIILESIRLDLGYGSQIHP